MGRRVNNSGESHDCTGDQPRLLSLCLLTLFINAAVIGSSYKDGGGIRISVVPLLVCLLNTFLWAFSKQSVFCHPCKITSLLNLKPTCCCHFRNAFTLRYLMSISSFFSMAEWSAASNIFTKELMILNLWIYCRNMPKSHPLFL